VGLDTNVGSRAHSEVKASAAYRYNRKVIHQRAGFCLPGPHAAPRCVRRINKMPKMCIAQIHPFGGAAGAAWR
jgi:hypothetical protein